MGGFKASEISELREPPEETDQRRRRSSHWGTPEGVPELERINAKKKKLTALEMSLPSTKLSVTQSSIHDMTSPVHGLD